MGDCADCCWSKFLLFNCLSCYLQGLHCAVEEAQACADDRSVGSSSCLRRRLRRYFADGTAMSLGVCFFACNTTWMGNGVIRSYRSFMVLEKEIRYRIPR